MGDFLFESCIEVYEMAAYRKTEPQVHWFRNSFKGDIILIWYENTEVKTDYLHRWPVLLDTSTFCSLKMGQEPINQADVCIQKLIYLNNGKM